jgi:hypothetical protein
MNDEITIIDEELVEFEYDNFSVFHDPQRSIWFLETYEDDEDREEVILENEQGIADFSEEELESLGFTEEEFLKLKTFLKEKK